MVVAAADVQQSPGLGLRGRRTELAALDRLLAEMRAGQSRVLVLRGEAGVGKTVLLDHLQERAPECCMVRRRAGLGSSTDAIAALRGRPFSRQFLACDGADL
jgi:hypothetical protein